MLTNIKLSDAERNRLKQQRSRARRKEYLTGLEDRLRDYERHGVQATVEVQNAARHVARENQALRKLLARHSVQPADIDAFLQHELLDDALRFRVDIAQNTKTPRGESSMDLASQLASPTASIAQNSPPAANGSSLVKSVALATDIFSPEQCANQPLRTQYNDVLDGDRCYQAVAKSTSAGSDGSSLQTAVYSDQISCEEAAQVIASMRGAANVMQILPELGCSESQRCMVKSSVVFELS